MTGHSHAYDSLEAEDAENAYCLQCHTVGWDRPVTFKKTSITVVVSRKSIF